MLLSVGCLRARQIVRLNSSRDIIRKLFLAELGVIAISKRNSCIATYFNLLATNGRTMSRPLDCIPGGAR